MYSLKGYGDMIADSVRYRAYMGALERTVRPGSVVLEIGTGPGIFAVQACRLGARRVFAVEPAPVIQVAREIAAANGCADKIEFIENISTKISIPLQADVIVSDLRGVLPLFQQHLPSIADARRRFLAPGGTLIPKQDAVWVSVVEAPREYAGLVEPWKHADLDAGPALALVLNDCQKIRAMPEQLLAAPALWATLDYYQIETAHFENVLDLSVARDGIGHGLLVWFDACLVDGIGFSNAPGKPEAIYGSMFFPWTEPVSLRKGQQLQVELKAKLVQNDYVWSWNTRFFRSHGATLAQFHQSQFKAAIFSKQKLQKSASDYVPRLSTEGILNRRALELMDGQLTLEQISKRLFQDFPGQFKRWQQALAFVTQLSDTNY